MKSYLIPEASGQSQPGKKLPIPSLTLTDISVHLMIDQPILTLVMFRNYFKSACRSLYLNGVFTVINITGLAVGIASVLLITLYILHELSYDRYHDKADRIYRVVENIQTDSEQLFQATTSLPMGPTLATEFPEVVGFVRFSNWLSDSYIVRSGDKVFHEIECYAADSSVFNIFSFHLLEGDPKTALVKPGSIVLTERTAKKYFGNGEALGRTLEVNQKNCNVTGVLANIPENSHFKFDMLISWSTEVANAEWEKNAWGFNACYTYLLLAKGDGVAASLASKIPGYIDKYIGNFSRETKSYYTDLPLQALPRIYLEAPRDWENGERGSRTNIIILGTIACAILIIACFNYTNLTTARVSRRLKEIGLRKTLGASRSRLVSQFLLESMIISIVSVSAGLFIALLFLPTFNNLAGTSLTPEAIDLPTAFLVLASGSILLGLLSGLYPALFASRYKPLQIFRASPKEHHSNQWLRKLLVSAQFTISITLIACTLFIFMQLDLLQTFNLGFNKERTLILDVASGDKSETHIEAIKEKLKAITGVAGVCASSNVPGESTGNSYCLIEKTAGEMSATSINTIAVDYDFISGYNVNLAAGRSFSRQFPSDGASAFLINQAAVRDLGLGSPEMALGRKIDLQGRTGTIIGVVQDFHYRSLHFRVEPLLVYINPDELQKLSVKIESANFANVIANMQRSWKVMTDLPFDYTFLDQDFDRLYKKENQLSKFILIFSGLSIFVACLGLIGLVSFSIKRRFKEIGIRKVLGSSILGILALFSRESVRLILFSFCIAVPLTYYLTWLWLQSFINRIAIQPMPFLIAGLSVLVVAIIVIAILSLKMARANPVEALRNE